MNYSIEQDSIEEEFEGNLSTPKYFKKWYDVFCILSIIFSAFEIDINVAEATSSAKNLLY